VVRFVIEGLLTVFVGPAFIQVAGTIFRQHFSVVAGVMVGAIATWLVLRQRARRRRSVPDAAKD
jgi:hypothetical protein